METKGASDPGTGDAKEQHIEIEIPTSLLQYLNSPDCNLQHICRICLSTSNEELYPLSSSKEYNILADMFLATTSIIIDLEDGLPSHICAECHTDVIHSYEFRAKCGKSDFMLRSLLKGEFSIKDEPSLNHDDMLKSDILNAEENINECINIVENGDYSDDLKNILSDDEALCIVQNTLKNEKKFTFFDRDPKHAVKEIVVSRTRSKHNKFNYTCKLCSQEFPKLKLLKAHEHRHTTINEPFLCNHCRKSFKTENDLKLHKLVHSKGPWKCAACQKEFQDITPFRRHIQRHMDTKRFACDTCDKTFAESYALKRHARVHSGVQAEKKHACSECGKRFADNGQLTAHMTRHSGARPCQCGVCGKAFASPRLLTSHRLVHSPHKPHACRYCDKRFRHESSRNTHHRTHTGEKPYVCSVCGKTFIQNSNMRLHMRTHTGEKPYSCSRCDAKFSSGSTLKAHERSHTGERPYKCPICGKGFARLNLKMHMRLHSGEKPFACQVCPKKYVNASLLRDHCRTHTGERPYECARCEGKYASKALLIRHLKNHEKKMAKKKEKRAKQNIVTFRPPIPKPENTPQTFRVQSLPEKYKVQTPPENFQVQSISNNEMQPVTDEIPNAIVELTLGTHETFDVSQELVFQDNNLRTHVIVLGTANTNTVSFVSNNTEGCTTGGLNIVTVNEIGVGVSISSNSNTNV